MAEGFAQHHGKGNILSSSAGTAPAKRMDESVIRVMKEKGIDISRHTPKKIDENMIARSDVVVTMGCCSAEELCPVSYHGRKVDWNIPDPKGGSIETFRNVRDIIEKQVLDLIQSLKTDTV
ncbi:MAG: arsenate reductase ArsC [Gemmatimonadota bacterium]|nr:MAG: arsenate reductase ArsC [Gemmatimonadota bacterium]